MARIFSNVKRVWDLSTGLAHVHWIWTLLPAGAVTLVIKLLSETPLWVAIVAGALIAAICIVLLHYFKNAHKMANPTRKEILDAPMHRQPPDLSPEQVLQLELVQLVADREQAIAGQATLQGYRDKVASVSEQWIETRKHMLSDETTHFTRSRLVSLDSNLPPSAPAGAAERPVLLELLDNSYKEHGPNSRGPETYVPADHEGNKSRYQENCQRLRRWIATLDRQLSERQGQIKKLTADIASRGSVNG